MAYLARMRLIIPLLFLALAAYLGFSAVDAAVTGVLIPKSPASPLLRAEQPVLFWFFTTGLGAIALWLVWLAIGLIRQKPKSAFRGKNG